MEAAPRQSLTALVPSPDHDDRLPTHAIEVLGPAGEAADAVGRLPTEK